jgi:hypothetical protein
MAPTWQISIVDSTCLCLLRKADRYLGRLEMYSEYVPIDPYIRMHIAKEATRTEQ